PGRAAKIGQGKGRVEQPPHVQRRGKAEQHGRKREVEDEFRQPAGRLGRKEARAPGQPARADKQEERQGLQKDRQHQSAAMAQAGPRSMIYSVSPGAMSRRAISRWPASAQKCGTSITAAGSVAKSATRVPCGSAISRLRSRSTGRGQISPRASICT